MPAWLLPLIYVCSLAKPFVLPGLTFKPECHIVRLPIRCVRSTPDRVS